ncbi:hypothetical protein SRHO_G00217140 [Serrasalmus rhombeus]
MAPRCIAEEVLLKHSEGVGEDLKEATRSACLLAAQGNWGWSTSESSTPSLEHIKLRDTQDQLHVIGGGGGRRTPLPAPT